MPAEYVLGQFRTGQRRPDTPVVARYARGATLNLRWALEGRSFCGKYGGRVLSRSNVLEVLEGRTWPVLGKVAKLEDVLGVTV